VAGELRELLPVFCEKRDLILDPQTPVAGPAGQHDHEIGQILHDLLGFAAPPDHSRGQGLVFPKHHQLLFLDANPALQVFDTAGQPVAFLGEPGGFFQQGVAFVGQLLDGKQRDAHVFRQDRGHGQGEQSDEHARADRDKQSGYSGPQPEQGQASFADEGAQSVPKVGDHRADDQENENMDHEVTLLI
jgi:hypothetical protein